MTATTLVRPMAVAEPQDGMGRPTQGEVNRAIIADAEAIGIECSRQEAHEFVCLLRMACQWMRQVAKEEGLQVDELPYHFLQDELDKFHWLLLVTMPDEAIAAPGTGHALVNRLLCRGNEIGLRHTMEGTEVIDCVVALDLITIAP